MRVDPPKLPTDLRPLAPLARKWGVGDDPARAFFLERATPAEKRAIRRRLTVAVRRRINEWLDSLTPRLRAAPEARALLYLLEAREETISS